ncbi:hypothetical protein [Halomicrobium salinisoli]|uniref:hypothetical protein n=1 Tax=Halomicrobium salinisoli TaxID=2878391 RepID=UPI001CF0B6E8|nr:hypothetical protein [Halomicrobium salinisoli]
MLGAILIYAIAMVVSYYTVVLGLGFMGVIEISDGRFIRAIAGIWLGLSATFPLM